MAERRAWHHGPSYREQRRGPDLSSVTGEVDPDPLHGIGGADTIFRSGDQIQRISRIGHDHRLDLPAMAVMQCVSKWGADSGKLVAAYDASRAAGGPPSTPAGSANS